MKKATIFLCAMLPLWGWQSAAQAQNTSCENAEAIALGDTINPQVQGQRWYKFPVTAGETYEVNGSEADGSAAVYPFCGGSFVNYGGGTFTFTAAATRDYYICVEGNNETSRWVVTQITDNSVCANAEAITLGDTVRTKGGQSRWYKIAVTAGESYGVSGREITRLSVRSSCDADGNNSVSTVSSGSLTIFSATATQDYYISVYSNNDTCRWVVTRNTDNLVCANATTVTLGDTVRTEGGQSRWYKIAATAGDVYEVGEAPQFDLYSSCGGSRIRGAFDRLLFAATATQDYYIRIYTYGTSRWVATRKGSVAIECSSAKAIAVGNTIQGFNTGEATFWYRVTLEANTWYLISSPYAATFSAYRACGGAPVAAGYNSAAGGYVWSFAEAGEYLIGVKSSSSNFEWSLKKIEGNAICQNAQPVALNAKTPVGSQASSQYLWYSAHVQAGRWYAVSAGRSVAVYPSCGGASIASGAGTAYFRAPGSAEVSIRYDANSTPDTLTIREVAAGDVPNTSCAAARSITAGQPVSATLPTGSYQLYYRLAVEAGKTYEIPRNDDGAYHIELIARTSCDEIGDYVAVGRLYDGVTFTAQATGEYIIELRPNPSPSSSLEISWQVNDKGVVPVTCALAETVSAGDTVHTPVANGLWYKFTPTSGKTYKIASYSTSNSSRSIAVYDRCQGGTELIYKSANNAYDSLVLNASGGGGVWYIRWNVSNAAIGWHISEFTPPAATNLTCAAAEQVNLGSSVSVMLTPEQERWYKLDVQAGKHYRISKSSSGANISAAVYTACGQSAPAATDSSKSGVSELVYHAAQAGAAYLRIAGSGSRTFEVYEAGIGEICETATTITAGQSVLHAKPYDTLWYRIEAAPGYLYTISNVFSLLFGYYEIQVYDGCGGALLGNASWRTPLSFSVSYATTCYIAYYNYSDDFQEWSVSQTLVEDNTVCSQAEAAPLNTPVTTAVEEGKTHWYYFLGEAGKFYEVSNCGGASFDTELRYGTSCEELSRQNNGCGSQERLLVQGEGKLVYFGWKAQGENSSGNVTWTVTEIPADNQLCAYAEPVVTGDTVRSTLSYNEMRWYQLAMQDGKTYEFTGSSSSGSSSMYFYVFSGTCDSAVQVAYGYTSLTFQPEETGVYYVGCRQTSNSSSFVWSWQVREVTENTICANAVAVAVNTPVSNAHTGGSPLWHAFTAPEAGEYDITAPAGQSLTVSTGGCEGSTPVATGSGSLTFTAAANTAYRIQWIASVSYAYSYTWSIGQHVAAALTELSVLNYPLSPEFSPQTTSYRVNVPHSETSVTIAAAASGGATVEGAGVKSVSVGDTTFTITVTDGGSSKSYTVLVHRASATAGSDATLSDLTVSAGSLTPSFSAGESSYAVSVEGTVSSITIGATATDTKASVNGAGTYSLSAGSGNVFQITVIAENGAQRIYTLTVTRATPPATPEVIGVLLTPSTAIVQKGSMQQFEATVSVVGGASQEVTWSVTGNTSAATTITNGWLTVDANETAATLTVTATSTANTARKGTATVTVTAPPAPEVLGVTVSPSAVLVQKGTAQQFSAAVSGTSSEVSQAVTWSVAGGSAGTAISATGLLTVAAGETADTLIVTATSAENTAKKGTATVALTTEQVEKTVISVSVTPATSSVRQGDTQQLTAQVMTTGVGTPDSVAWSVSGNLSAGTTVSATGLLTVAANETAKTLIVTATSTFDQSKSGKATISVIDQSVPEVTSVTVSPATSTVTKGKTLQLTAIVTVTPSDKTEVTWQVTGGTAGTTIDPTGLLTVSATEATGATLTVTATSAYDNTKHGTATVTVSAETGVEDQLTAAITLYPNPFAGTLHLSGAEGCTLRVISTSGATLYLRQLTSPSEAISLESLPAGLYFFHLEKDGKSKTLQAVKN